MKPTEKELIQLFERKGRLGVEEFVRHLIFDQNVPSQEILFVTRWHDHVALLEAVLTSNLDVNVTNIAGATPLYYGASVGFRGEEERHCRVCELLINQGADVNRRHRIRFEAPARVLDGETALMTAARTNAASIIRLLLSRGADPLVKDANGLDALDHALRRGNSDAVNILKRK